VLDAAGEVSNEATVSLTIVPVNDAPVAGDNTVTVAEGAMAVVDAAADDLAPALGAHGAADVDRAIYRLEFTRLKTPWAAG